MLVLYSQLVVYTYILFINVMILNLITNQENYMIGRNGVSVSEIVIHTNGGSASQGLHNWFQNNTIQVSAHWQVYLSGEIEQYVKNEDTAYHAGVWEENLKSIGIEHEDNGNSTDSVRTNEQYEASAQLIANLYRQNNLPFNDMGRIKPHHEFVPSRPCPDGLSIDRLRSRVNEVLNPKPVSIPVPTVLDNLYKVFKNSVELGAFANEQNALDCYMNNKADTILQNNNNLTVTFQDMVNQLQDQINSLNDKNLNLNNQILAENATNTSLKDQLNKNGILNATLVSKSFEKDAEITDLSNQIIELQKHKDIVTEFFNKIKTILGH